MTRRPAHRSDHVQPQCGAACGGGWRNDRRALVAYGSMDINAEQHQCDIDERLHSCNGNVTSQPKSNIAFSMAIPTRPAAARSRSTCRHTETSRVRILALLTTKPSDQVNGEESQQL